MGVLVADLQFGPDDITGLAQKLSQVQGLTETEYGLLLAIFAAAAARVEVTDPATGASTLPKPEIVGLAPGPTLPDVTQVTPADLQQQLLTAYIPGNYFGGAAAAGRITGGDPPSGQAGNPPMVEGGPA
jgi:hypothetical protein